MPRFLPLPFHRPAGSPKGRRNGVHFQRLGGAPVWTPAANLPRVGAVLAVRCFVLFPRPRRAVVIRLNGRVLRRVPLSPPVRQPDGRVQQVVNEWLSLEHLAPGPHRLTIEPSGPFAWVYRRGRRFMRVEQPFLPDSDASLPPGLGDDVEAGVAALPSVVRSAARTVLPGPVRSILVVRADQLGDLAVSIPAVRRLRTLFPEARLTLLATAGNAEFAAATGLFDAIEPIAYVGAGMGSRALSDEERARLEQRLGAERFDVALDLGEGPDSRLLLLLADASFTYGFVHGNHGWLSAGFDLRGRDPANALEVIAPSRKLLALVEALGALVAPHPRPMLPAPPDVAALARHGLAPGQPFLLIHAGARLAYNRWPHVAALVERLLARTDLPLILFPNGPEEVPAGLSIVHAARLHVIEGLIPFAEFDALLSSAQVMVGNDSGPKHLAALRGTRVVSLHTARLNWNEWGQEGQGLILSRRVPCAGCGIGPDPAECGRGFPCLTGITADEACEAVLSLL